MRIVLIGPPGAGKGTQARVVASHLRIPAISTGDIFRTQVARDTSLGRSAKQFMEAGELVPDEVTNGMVRQRLAEPDAVDGFLLDGFPRSAVQGDILDQMLAAGGSALDAVLELRAADDEIIRRLSGRRQCRAHGHVSHVDLAGSSQTCHVCGAGLYTRDDDREEVVRHRLEVYRSQTRPLLDRYADRRLLVTVKAEGTVAEVTERIMTSLSDREGVARAEAECPGRQ